MRCILLAFAGHATAVAKASSDPPWHSLRVSEPRPGGQFKSPIAVNLNVLLVPGLSSEVQAHAEQYQVCYTGGVRAICTLFGGNGSKVGNENDTYLPYHHLNRLFCNQNI